QVRQVRAVGIAVEWRIDIGAGVGDHVDAPDLEGRGVVVVRSGAFTLPKVADVWTRQAPVGRHAMLDHMAEVDDPLLFKIRHDANAPIISHRTFNAADGKAPCHQPLITKPAAPTTFMPW